VTKPKSSVRPVPLPACLIPKLRRWKRACPITQRGLVFPSELNVCGERGPIDADKLLRHILRRASRRAGLPVLRFHDLRHIAGTLRHEADVSLKRAQEILGHSSERSTLAIYTHSVCRTHDDSRQNRSPRWARAGTEDPGKLPRNKWLRRASRKCCKWLFNWLPGLESNSLRKEPDSSESRQVQP
jgi:integrase